MSASITAPLSRHRCHLAPPWRCATAAHHRHRRAPRRHRRFRHCASSLSSLYLWSRAHGAPWEQVLEGHYAVLVVRIPIAIQISTLGVAVVVVVVSVTPCSESCRAHVRYGKRVGVLARGRRREAPLKRADIAKKSQRGRPHDAQMLLLCASFTSVSRIPRTRLRIPQAASGPRPTSTTAPFASNLPEITSRTARSFRGLDCGGMRQNLRVRGKGAFKSGAGLSRDYQIAMFGNSPRVETSTVRRTASGEMGERARARTRSSQQPRWSEVMVDLYGRGSDESGVLIVPYISSISS